MRQLLLSSMMFLQYGLIASFVLYFIFGKSLEKMPGLMFFLGYLSILNIYAMRSLSFTGTDSFHESLLQMMFVLALYVIPCGVGLYRTRDLPTGKNKFFLALLLLPLGEILLLCIFMATALPLS